MKKEGPKAGPKGRQLEVGPRRGPRLLVHYNCRDDVTAKCTNNWHFGEIHLAICTNTILCDKLVGAMSLDSQRTIHSPKRKKVQICLCNRYLSGEPMLGLKVIKFS